MSEHRSSLWDKTCLETGKRMYRNRARARTARTRQKDGRHLGIYFCSGCGGYHLGHLSSAVVSGALSRSEAYG